MADPRRIIVDPITRIEGHLRIELEMGADGTVADAFSSSTAFRGVELIMKGRDPRDLGLFAQRICGVCTYHHYERGTEAVERAYGVRIPPNARLVRNLLWIGQILQDHAVHFYQLHSMDWWDVISALSADPAAAVEMATRYHPTPYNAGVSHYTRVAQRVGAFAASGQLGPFAGGYWGHPKYRFSPEQNLVMASHYLDNLAIQRLAAQMDAILGGKNPHPQSLVVGGVTSVRDALNADRLGQYQFLLKQVTDFVDSAYMPDLKMLAQTYKDEALAGHGGGIANYLSFGSLPLDDERWEDRTTYLPRGIIRGRDLGTVEDVDPAKIVEEVAHSWYTYDGDQTALNPLQGQTNPDYTGLNEDGTLKVDGKYSWLKTPRYDGLPMEVGPLARMLVGYASGQGDIKQAMDGFASDLGLPFEFWYSTVGRTVARGLETKLVAAKAHDFLNELIANVSSGDERFFSDYTASDGEGWSLTDVPRGSLSHWVRVEGGRIENFQAVVPSTWNASPRDGQGQIGAYEAALIGQPLADPEQPLEVLRTIHSFDPCMACAVHLLDADGAELAKVKVEV
jgi:quinone-reactive Ni/Fe-hydrogenase large subunit